MTKYIVRAALHDEANVGWIWTRGFDSRTVVMVSNLANGRSVYCQVREIDRNFTTRYNVPESRRFDLIESDTIVMGQWYRDCLGVLNTTSGNNKTDLIDLKIEPLSAIWRWWGSLRAAAHHPDIVVRLGVMGVWLGLVGVGIPLLQMIASCEWAFLAVTTIIIVAFMAIGTWACWPPRFKAKS